MVEKPKDHERQVPASRHEGSTAQDFVDLAEGRRPAAETQAPVRKDWEHDYGRGYATRGPASTGDGQNYGGGRYRQKPDDHAKADAQAADHAGEARQGTVRDSEGRPVRAAE
ncbi:hypothetical protein [Zavarzinia sp. CC-PAN008]|uniref:hypothetical protein n=1 Tax=Zavarzinia sp. CC-PAN008 TaxID=3243332 RepID=UPI003F742209